MVAALEKVTPLRDARREFTRTRIRDAAREVFFTRGYAGATMEHIAEASGARRSTLYNHFRDKAEILAVIAQDYTASLAGVLAQVPAPTPGLAEVAAWVREVAAFVARERLPTILLSEVGIGQEGGDAASRVGGFLLQTLARRLPAFARALEPGGERQRIDALIALRNLSWCCLRYAQEGGEARGEDYLAAAAELFHGFVSRPAPGAQDGAGRADA